MRQDNEPAVDDGKEKENGAARPAGKVEGGGHGARNSSSQSQSAIGRGSNSGGEWVAEIYAYEAALMASIREIRKTWMPVVIALVVIDLACVGYLLSPAGRSRQARQRDYYEQRARLTAKREEVLPTRGMDRKLLQASSDINKFYGQRFPTKYSEVAEELGKAATETGVHFAGVKYDDKDAPIEGLRKMTIEIALSGDYLQEVKFINELERDKMFFLIDGIALGEQQGNVRLQLKLETYLRSGAETS